MSGRLTTARALYEAFAAADRDAAEALLAAGFTFSSGPDPDLDRAGYFERCWPNSGNVVAFDFVRLVESGGEVAASSRACPRTSSSIPGVSLPVNVFCWLG